MIDWVTCRIGLPCPLPRPIHGGKYLTLDENDNVQLTRPKNKKVAGSHEASVQVRAPGVYEIELSGNFVKFLQGHNLWGTTDLPALVWSVLQRCEAIDVFGCSLDQLGLTPMMLSHCVQLSRVDCTSMLLADSLAHVRSALRSLGVGGRLRDRGKSGLPHAWDKGEGVSFGSAPKKTAQHRSITFYSKGLDVRKHKLPDAIAGDGQLIEWVDRCLRAEVRLGAKYLKKRGLRSLSAWTTSTAFEQWDEMMARMDMNGSDEQPAALADLPAHLRVTYGAWLSGTDLRSILSKPTYYRQRQAILKALDVDIAIPRPSEPTAQIVPIRRIIELRPADRPHFADRIERALAAA